MGGHPLEIDSINSIFYMFTKLRNHFNLIYIKLNFAEKEEIHEGR